MKEKIKVVYIVGSGYCGSTLLDRILGTSKNAISSGEIAFYESYRQKDPLNLTTKQFICACGESFDDCDFWSRVALKGDFKTNKRFTALDSLKSVLAGVSLGLVKLGPIADDSYELYKSVLEISEKEYIIDSSKDPRRLYQLSFDKRIELYPIVLFRDARAVVNSYLTRKKKHVGHVQASFLNIVFVRWLTVYFVGLLLALRMKNRVILSYEDFCKYPESTIESINRRVGLNVDTNSYLNQMNTSLNHNIDGNSIRGKEIKQIVLIERWKKELSSVNKLFAFILTWPLYQFSRLFYKRN